MSEQNEKTLSNIREAPSKWPEPTIPAPDDDTVEFWIIDGVCDATDGCIVEPDGICPHGHPSWLLHIGII